MENSDIAPGAIDSIHPVTMPWVPSMATNANASCTPPDWEARAEKLLTRDVSHRGPSALTRAQARMTPSTPPMTAVSRESWVVSQKAER